ncbi:MAG: type II secretion system protein GspD [Candidatus Omnitrophica bacterium]|nr:type II secretion system protein GspD [Candidatus Omnitrophota bacterium]
MKKIPIILAIIMLNALGMQAVAEEGDSAVGAVEGVKKAERITDVKDQGIPRIEEGMDGYISLDLRNIDIVDALKFLAMKAGINIVATKNVTGRVTLMVEGVLIKDIFDIMLRSNELAYVKKGDIYNVMTESEYKAIYGKKFSDVRQVKTFRLKYAIPEQAFTLLDTLKSDVGRVLVEPDSGTALIMDTPEHIKAIEESLATLEQENMVKVFPLEYAHAKDVEQQLKVQLDAKKVGSIKADERANLVIVQALPDRMKNIEELIKALDNKTKEVLIDTKIVKIKLSDQIDKRFEWEGIMKIAQRYGMTYLSSTPFGVVQKAADAWIDRREFLHNLDGQIGGYPSSGFTTESGFTGSAVAPGEAMHIGIVDRNRDMDIMIKFLNTLGNTQILSNPKLAVVNGQEARIHVGERQAYVTTTTTTGQTTTTVSEEVTFIDVGIQLAVTPVINNEGYIRLKIKPEISSVTGELETPTGNKIPIIDTSMAETTVLVKDGSTIIIGGLRKEEKTGASEELPYLGKIPILGFLFGSKFDKTERTELLIMITPTIVTGDVLTTGDDTDLYKMFKDYKDYSELKNGAPLSEGAEDKEVNFKPYKQYVRD